MKKNSDSNDKASLFLNNDGNNEDEKDGSKK
jgi:hypothetical protein